MIEVWFGTPHELAKGASKDSQSAAVKWGRDHLMGLERQAIRYDKAALEHIRSVREQMLKTPEIASGVQVGWEFPYLDITVRIEIRND